MKLSPVPRPSCDQPNPSAAEVVDAEARGKSWRWAVLHFPWLEEVSPNGHIVMVSDKQHIAEARRKYPDLPLWHEKELAKFGDLMDSAGLGEQAFVAVNRLKLKTCGWFMGVEAGEPAMSGDTAKRQE